MKGKLAAVTDEALLAMVAQGRSHASIAAEVGVERSGVTRRLQRVARRLAAAPAPVEDKPGPYRLGGSAADREVLKLRAEVVRLRAELESTHKASMDEDEVRAALGVLAAGETEAPDWLVDVSPGRQAPEVLMTAWADWHLGESVSAAETNGVNAYGTEIAETRVRRLVERTIRLAREQGPGAYPGAVVCLLGDFVSGGLHPELKATDEEEVLASALRARDLLVWGLRRMADEFGSVYAPAVAGNHGRATPKPEFKRYAYKNFDWLIYQLLVREFAGDPRIRIDVRPSNEVYFRVYGKRFLAMHGDMLGVKGGDGIIGALGPISRGEVKVRGSAASSGMAYDMLLIGHWHQELWLPRCIVANTLKGYDEYARLALRAPPSPPSQPLWFVHPRYGVTGRWNVLVEEPAAERETPWVSVFDPTLEAA